MKTFRVKLSNMDGRVIGDFMAADHITAARAAARKLGVTRTTLGVRCVSETSEGGYTFQCYEPAAYPIKSVVCGPQVYVVEM